MEYLGPVPIAGQDIARIEDVDGGSRSISTATTTSLAQGAIDSTTHITVAKSFTLFSVQTSRPARVRLYATVAARTADLARVVSTPPSVDAGVILDYVTTDTAVHFLNPVPFGASLEATPTASTPMSVTNNDPTSGSVVVTLAALGLE